MSDVNKATSSDNDNKDVCAVKSDMEITAVSNEETIVTEEKSTIDGNDEAQVESVETPIDDATDLAGILDGDVVTEEVEFSAEIPADVKRHVFRKKSRQTVLANALIKRSIKYLNKMHVMEDVHEGCVTQPSSPGHADQRQAMMEDICKKESNGISATLISEIKQEGNTGETPIKQENVSEHHELTNGDAEAHGTEDSASNDSVQESSLKRKLESETNETPTKRIHVEMQRSFDSRDKFLKKCMEHIGGSSFEQLQGTTVQLLTEIRTLNELAKQKEKEWNTILHFKKFKEELLLRLERKKQILLLNLDEFDPEAFENVDGNNKQGNNRNPLSYIERNQAYKKNFNGRNLSCNNFEIGGGPSDYRQNKQRPTLDVKSLIADYRQKHPETVPRRGRRIRTIAHQSEAKVAGNVMNPSNMALGSGAQVVHNLAHSEMNRDLQLLHSMEELRRDQGINLDLSGSDMTSFKDMLVQFAKLSQTEKDILRNNAKPPPPPYPEVTVHPVPTTTASSSLLHGILTKNQPSKSESKSTFSPTLARLLTAPEKSSPQGSMNHNNMTAHTNVSTISDILSNSKARNEITITPVLGQYDVVKGKHHLDEEEAEDSVDRLVIDEGGELVDARSKDNNSDAGDEVPQCQGCNQKSAQFVCAGCGNQWYCSRDCQVSAWDEHSEVCSG